MKTEMKGGILAEKNLDQEISAAIRSPVKKTKVGMSSWLFLTHPLFPSLL